MDKKEIMSTAWLQSVKQLPPRQDIYARLKEHGGIVFDTAEQCWLVSNPIFVRQILSNSECSSSMSRNNDAFSDDPDFQNVLALLSRQVLFQDGVEHERLKALMVQPLQQHIHHLQPEISQHIELVLDDLSQLTQWDLVNDFALPLAAWIMARLIGLAEQPQERLLTWGINLADVTCGKLSRLRTLQQVLEMQDVCLYIAQERRVSPQGDLISSFVAQSNWKSDEELVGNAMTIFGAGISTIPKAIAHALLFLYGHCKLQAKVMDGEKDILEFLLCWVSPTRFIVRWANASFSIGAYRIEAGQQLYLLLEATNQDLLGIDCKHHLAFGLPSNPHYCIGASLARMVLQQAISRLLARFPHLRLVEGGPWGDNPNLSGITLMRVSTGEK